MKKKHAKTPPPKNAAPGDGEIRAYAHHLFEQSGRISGRDLENWLEAKACLKAGIPLRHSHARPHPFVLGLGPAMQEELCESSGESRPLAR